MAQVIFQTKLDNVNDTGSTDTSVNLNALVPLSRNVIISSRKFTPKTNYSFSILPSVDFSKTAFPNRYSFTSTNTTDTNGVVTAVTISVFYTAPLNNEDILDIVTFTGSSYFNPAVSADKIKNYIFPTALIPSQGKTEQLNIYGDQHATCTIDFEKYAIERGGTQPFSLISGPKQITVPQNGQYQENIKIPKTTGLVKYKLTITEDSAGTFRNMTSPVERFYFHYPEQRTLFTLSDSALGTTLPASVTYNYYHDYKDNNDTYDFFRFQVYKNSFNFAKKTTFDASVFTVVSGVSSSETHTPVDPTSIEFFDLNIEIDNDGVTNGDATRAYAVISGRLKILSGYDAGGHTTVSLNVNDILKSA